MIVIPKLLITLTFNSEIVAKRYKTVHFLHTNMILSNDAECKSSQHLATSLPLQNISWLLHEKSLSNSCILSFGKDVVIRSTCKIFIRAVTWHLTINMATYTMNPIIFYLPFKMHISLVQCTLTIFPF